MENPTKIEAYNFKDITLFELCQSFFKKAIDTLQQYLNTKGQIPKETFYEPVPEFDRTGTIKSISYVPYEEEDFAYLIFGCHELIESLPETKTACKYISDKKYLVIGGANYAPYILLYNALKIFFQKTKAIDYHEHEFIDSYIKIEHLVFGNEFTFRSSAKLENFSCTKSLIKFDEMHFLKTYTQEECKELYRHPSINIYDYTLPHPGDFRVEVVKSKDKDNWGKAGMESIEEIKQILTTLRLFKDSTIGIGPLESSEPITWFPFTGKSRHFLASHIGGDLCSIEENEIDPLINLWKTIGSAKYENSPPLEIAIKRFNYAHGYTKYTDLSNFPIPVLFFKRGGLASGIEELNEIMQKIVYPIINESSDPISTMIIEYYPHSAGNIGVEIYWTNGGMQGALIDKSTDGHYDSGGYKVFFKKPTP